MKKIIVAVLTIILTACATTSPLPVPSVSEFVKTEGGGFLMERKVGVKYAMTYTLTQSLNKDATYKAIFESTIPNGKPVVVEGRIEQGVSKLLIRSPVIPGVKNNQKYSVILTLFESGELVTEHKDEVLFSVPPTMLEKLTIKEY